MSDSEHVPAAGGGPGDPAGVGAGCSPATWNTRGARPPLGPRHGHRLAKMPQLRRVLPPTHDGEPLCPTRHYTHLRGVSDLQGDVSPLIDAHPPFRCVHSVRVSGAWPVPQTDPKVQPRSGGPGCRGEKRCSENDPAPVQNSQVNTCHKFCHESVLRVTLSRAEWT